MSVNSLTDLFYDTLRDVYWAEKHLVKALPKMAKAASSTELSEAILKHQAETETHVERLERIFEILDKRAREECGRWLGYRPRHHVLEKERHCPRRRHHRRGAGGRALRDRATGRTAWASQLGLEDAAKLADTLEEEGCR